MKVNTASPIRLESETDSLPERVLPDAKICRAKAVTCMLAECLVDQPWECSFAVPFGCGFMCMCADRECIIARTRESEGTMRAVVADRDSVGGSQWKSGCDGEPLPEGPDRIRNDIAQP